MKLQNVGVLLILIGVFALAIPEIQAEPAVSIIMEKTTYSYCEKLFYTIEVSEITEELAIINIRDGSGKGSSAIPIAITDLQNPVPSLVAFEKEIFPLGKYFIDVRYSGAEATAEFNLIDSNKVCIPGVIKPIIINWINGNISDGFLIDAFQKFVDKEILNIPFEISQENVFGIDIPDWMKYTAYWWIQDEISDDEFIQTINYLIDHKIISIESQAENEI